MTVHIALVIGESLGVVNGISSSKSSKTTSDDIQMLELPSTSSYDDDIINNNTTNTVILESTELCLGLSDIFVALFLVKFYHFLLIIEAYF